MDGALGTVTPSSDNVVTVSHQSACGVSIYDIISAIGLSAVGTKPYWQILVMCACFLITQSIFIII